MKTLKKIAFAFFALLILSSFTNITDTQYSGKWKGKDKGDIGFLILSNDGFATFEFNNQSMGGKSYNHQGVNASMAYTIDENAKPISIDFIINDIDANTELGRIQGIIEMNSKDEMHMAMAFGGGPRPTDFSKDDIIFNRVE